MTFEEIKSRLKDKIVGIAGAGGLGSNCAASLVRVGVRNLIIADFDVVAESNLNRQFYFYDQIGMKKVEALKINLLRINPEANIVIIDEKLNPQTIVLNYSNCDVIVEAFDKADQKQMLIETCLTYFPEKKIVCGNGLAGFGELDLIKVHNFGNLIICGDMKNEVGENAPPIAPKVNIVANMEADVVLQILLSQ